MDQEVRSVRKEYVVALNEHHRTEYLTASHMISQMFDRTFPTDILEVDRAQQQFLELNPAVSTLLNEISEKLGELYQAIGNANYTIGGL